MLHHIVYRVTSNIKIICVSDAIITQLLSLPGNLPLTCSGFKSSACEVGVVWN